MSTDAIVDLSLRPSPNPRNTDVGRLLLHCNDQPGIVAAVGKFLAARGANISALAQHSTGAFEGRFFQRTVFHLDNLAERRDEVAADFQREIADRFNMSWSLSVTAERKKVAIFVSKYDHCLLDLLWRNASGDLDMDIQFVVSNHPDLADAVRRFGIRYEYVPLIDGDKAAMEARQLELVAGNVDFVVMARYMQILSDDFLERISAPVINIHHSFLPAFMGANPYARAKARGVKLIGATAHYATADLDEGPIIEQDVIRVTHREEATELQRRGADVERAVLARAVRWHCEDRVVVHGNSTVVLD